jgi:protein-disulfide isomerase
MRIALMFTTMFISLAGIAFAQGPVRSVQQERAAVLKAPAGSKAAIVIFEDLQCPDCARAHPLVRDVAKQENVPVLRHDFPLPKHDWSFKGSVIARYFDSKSPELGEKWRMYCYSHQEELTPDNIMQRAAQFGKANSSPLPFAIDPDGKLEAKVKADFRLGQKIGIQHTPTIWVVGTAGSAEPFVEVVDRSQMASLIRKMKANAK